MARKRRFEQLEAAASAPQKKETYVDPLQSRVLPRVEEAGKKLEGKGRTILYAIGALILLVLIGLFVARWMNKSGSAAQAALGKAIETSQAQVTDAPQPATATQKTYKTEKERSEAAIAQFQQVVDQYGGSVAEKAKYFIAVNKLFVDRPAAISELEQISSGSSDSAKMAKFALAQTRVEDNRLDDALNIYQELANMSDPIVAKETINFEIAKIYEKQGKKDQAVEAYFNIAKNAAEAKDMDGKPARMSQTASDAKDKVKELAPEKAKEIPEQEPASPFGD
jgi:predicted negative regulator of RcsB-dependent stress response